MTATGQRPGAGQSIGPDALAKTVDHVAISRLQHAYADGINGRDWGAIAALFRPDAHVHLDLVDRPAIDLKGPDAITAFIEPAVAGFTFFVFAILSSHVELWPDGDRNVATARLHMCELRTALPEVDGGLGEETRAFGVYRDRYVRTADGWRIAGRRYRSLARSPGGIAFPHPGS